MDNIRALKSALEKLPVGVRDRLSPISSCASNSEKSISPECVVEKDYYHRKEECLEISPKNSISSLKLDLKSILSAREKASPKIPEYLECKDGIPVYQVDPVIVNIRQLETPTTTSAKPKPKSTPSIPNKPKKTNTKIQVHLYSAQSLSKLPSPNSRSYANINFGVSTKHRNANSDMNIKGINSKTLHVHRNSVAGEIETKNKCNAGDEGLGGKGRRRKRRERGGYSMSGNFEVSGGKLEIENSELQQSRKMGRYRSFQGSIVNSPLITMPSSPNAHSPSNFITNRTYFPNKLHAIKGKKSTSTSKSISKGGGFIASPLFFPYISETINTATANKSKLDRKGCQTHNFKGKKMNLLKKRVQRKVMGTEKSSQSINTNSNGMQRGIGIRNKKTNGRYNSPKINFEGSLHGSKIKIHQVSLTASEKILKAIKK